VIRRNGEKFQMLTKHLPWIDAWIGPLSILTDPILIPDSILDRSTICGSSPSLDASSHTLAVGGSRFPHRLNPGTVFLSDLSKVA
jgi:hypothetical protein